MIISQSGIVDIIPEYNRALRPIFCVSEGDADSRMINITVQNAGNNFNIPEGASVYVAGKKLDGTIFTYECTYSGYIVTFPITEQMSAVSGLVLCEIQIVVAGDPLGSANFCFWVEPSPIENGTTSESDLNIFVQAVSYLRGYEFLTDEVAVLSARMDQFARLPDGSLSTAADAELTDIRVKANGETATTAGDAVREQVAELKEGLDVVIDSNTNYRHTDIPVYQTVTGWELKGDGSSSQASGFIIRKYKVTAGDLIYLKITKDGNGTFQFQSSTSVPGNVPNPYLVGTAHTSAIDGYVIAPSGATYLIVSQLADNVSNVIQNITYDYDMDTNFMFMMGNPSFTNKIFVVNGSTITIQSKPRLFLYYKGKTYTFPGDVAQEYTLTNGKTLVFDTDALISGGINVSSISQIFYLVDYAAYSDKCIPVCNYRKDSYTDRLFWSPLFAQYYYENLTDDSQTSQQIDNRLLETYLIGHGRDYYTAPENTLPLWELQRSRGLNVLEGDVAVTSDGVPVLLHDTTIDRTSDGTGNIADMTYAQASQYNYNSGHTSYGNVALPTLAEFLSYAHKYNMCIELDMAGHTYTDANIRTIITMVIEKGMLTRTIFTMSASDAYQKVLSVDARCIVMATNVTTTANIDSALSYKAKFVSIPFASLTSALCDYAHSKGMLVKAWTIDTASDCLNAFETGADCADVDKISYDDVFGIQ